MLRPFLLFTVSFLSMLQAGSVSAPGSINPAIDTATNTDDDISVENNEGGDDPISTAIQFPSLTPTNELPYTYKRIDTRNDVVKYIDFAKETIDIAAHTIDDPEIIKAINSAKGRGVVIRLFIQKLGSLQGKYSATENFNIQDIAYQTTKITTSFLPDSDDKNFKYSVQKMAYVIVDNKLVSILTRLPRNKDQQYFTQGMFLNNPDLAGSLKIAFDYHVSGASSKPAPLIRLVVAVKHLSTTASFKPTISNN